MGIVYSTQIIPLLTYILFNIFSYINMNEMLNINMWLGTTCIISSTTFDLIIVAWATAALVNIECDRKKA